MIYSDGFWKRKYFLSESDTQSFPVEGSTRLKDVIFYKNEVVSLAKPFYDRTQHSK